MAKAEWYCVDFERTGLRKPQTIEQACRICPLRNKDGDCPKDVIQDYGERVGDKLSVIWEAFHAPKKD